MSSFGERVYQIRYNVQSGVSSSSKSFGVFLLRLFSGTVLGLVFAIAFDEVFAFGNLGFVFVAVMSAMTYLYISRGWGVIPILIFDLFCVLVGLLLRFYVIVAPGA